MTTPATNPRGRKTEQTAWAKPPASVIFRTDAGILLVPLETMWEAHNASKPSAVMNRAQLPQEVWSNWAIQSGQDWPQVKAWLYHASELPQGVLPDQRMRTFRKHSAARAIARVIERSTEEMNLLGHGKRSQRIDDSTVSGWAQRFKDLTWFPGWLLRGENPPPDVAIAEPDQIRRCRIAWDFMGICSRVFSDRDAQIYRRWLWNDKILDREWLKWLWGWPPPDGAYVVPKAIIKLRTALTRGAICEAAGITHHTLRNWETNEVFWRCLEEARQHARTPAAKHGPPSHSESWKNLDKRAQQNMWLFVQAEKFSACCERVDLELSEEGAGKWGRPDYHQEERKAERMGVAQSLDDFLHCRGSFVPGEARTGLLAQNFFVPSKEMLVFRDEAKKLAAEQRIAQLEKITGFSEWFMDWVLPANPGERRGRRFQLPNERLTETKGPTAPPLTTLPAPDTHSPVIGGVLQEETPKSRGGRPRSKETEAVYKACWEAYTGPGKMVNRLRKAQVKLSEDGLGAKAPKDESALRLYARRYVEFHPELSLDQSPE